MAADYIEEREDNFFIRGSRVSLDSFATISQRSAWSKFTEQLRIIWLTRRRWTHTSKPSRKISRRLAVRRRTFRTACGRAC